jgi:hypothetical protein
VFRSVLSKEQKTIERAGNRLAADINDPLAIVLTTVASARGSITN